MPVPVRARGHNNTSTEMKVQNSLTRRQILGAGLIVGSSALLAACASPSPSATTTPTRPVAPTGPVTLRMSWWGSDDRTKRTQQALALFQNRNPNITVNGEFTGDFNGYSAKLSTQIAGGSAPDVIQMSGQFIASYATRGALLDLNPYFPDVIDTSKWDKASVEEASYVGGVRGLSVGYDGYATVYDKGGLDALGIAAPKSSWTWSDFESILSDVVSARGKYKYGCSDGGGRYEVLSVFLRQNGTDLFVDGKPVFKASQIESMWGYWGGLRDKGLIVTPDIQAAWTGALDGTPLVQGLAAFEFASLSTLLSLKALMKSPVAINTIPFSDDGKAGQVVRSPQYFSAFGKTKNPYASAQLIQFLLNDPDAAKILGTTRSVPVSPLALEAINPQLTAAERETVTYLDLLTSSGATPIQPMPPQFTDFNALLQRTYQAVSFGKSSIKDGATTLVEEAGKLFA